MTAIGAMTLKPFPPLATPNMEELLQAQELSIGFANSSNSSSKSRKKFEILVTKLVNQVSNIPGAWPLAINLKRLGGPKTSYLRLSQMVKGHERDIVGGPEYDSLQANIASIIAMFAVGYRQAIAREMLMDAIAEAQVAAKVANPDNTDYGISAKYGEIAQYVDPNSFALRHPAAILTDYQRMGLEFEEQARPQLADVAPSFEWTEPEARLPSVLTFKIIIPDTIAASLPGQKLSRLIALDDKVLAKLAPHAALAWDQVTIANVVIHGSDRIVLELEPARQISWIPGMLPHTHTPSNNIERAIVNLARSAEIV